MTIDFAAANFIGIALETLLFGIFLALFSFMMITWTERLETRPSRGRHTPLAQIMLLSAATIIAVSVIAHWVCNIWRLYEAFVLIGVTGGGAAMSLGTVSDPRSVIRMAAFMVSAFTGDTVMLWRVRAVYDKSILVLIFPVLAFTSEVVGGVGLVHAFRTASVGSVFNPSIGNWITASCSSALAMNLYSSIAIIARLWYVSRRTYNAGLQKSPLSEAMNMFAESILLWTTFAAATFFSFVAKSNLQAAFIEMTSPIIGISFCWLMLRINLRRKSLTEATQSTSGNNRSAGTGPNFSPQSPVRPFSVYVPTRNGMNGMTDPVIDVKNVRQCSQDDAESGTKH